MITFPHLRNFRNLICQKRDIIKYIYNKKQDGYILLKNPKGAPFTEVNMIKENYRCSENLDDIFVTRRIKTNFTKNECKEQEKLCWVTHYFNPDTFQLYAPRKKSFFTSLSINSKVVSGKIKTIPYGFVPSSKKIELPLIDRITQKLDINDKNYYKKKYLKEPDNLLYSYCHGLLLHPRKNRSSFLTVLLKNLINNFSINL